jgi:hypothetical protein
LEINDVRNCCLADLLNPGRCFGVDDLAASVFYLVLHLQMVARMVSMSVEESQFPMFDEGVCFVIFCCNGLFLVVK